MKLSEKEFKYMNSKAWMIRQKNVPFKTFKSWGLAEEKNKDILEIGCGNGYSAVLLSEIEPKSYYGIDVMEEMIDIANKRNLDNCNFVNMDATDLKLFPDKSKDIVVIFTILHHIRDWKKVVKECYRVLKDGGKMYVEEPNRTFVTIWDTFFKFGHEKEALFSYNEFQTAFEQTGFSVKNKKVNPLFGSFCFQK